MSAVEAWERVVEAERDADLLRYEYDGWAIWPMFRFRVIRALEARPQPPIVTGVSTQSRIGAAITDAVAMGWLPHAEVVAKTYSTARLEHENGRSRDVFFDEILGRCRSFFKIERRTANIGLPPLVPAHMTTEGVQFLATGQKRWRSAAPVDRLSIEFSRKLESSLGAAVLSPRQIGQRLQMFFWQKRIFRWMLAKMQPQVVLTADAGEFDVSAAARELSIPVVELQHGIIPRHHASYSWTGYARPFKQRIPGPNRLLLYGQYWVDELKQNGFWEDELVATGSPRMDRHRSQPRTPSNVTTLLFTAGGSDTARIIAFLGSFLDQIGAIGGCRLIIKTHPSFPGDEALYMSALGGRANVQILGAGSRADIFELLRVSDMHVSVFSTCHYDALALGIPTVVLPFAGHENVTGLCASGDARLARTPEELVAFASGCRNLAVADTGNKYFRHNALVNIMSALGVEQR